MDIALLYSRYLIQREGSQTDAPAFSHGHHGESLRATEGVLKDLRLRYKLWDEEDSELDSVFQGGPRLIIVPYLRVADEKTFQGLIQAAERGAIVLATLDSFYYRCPGTQDGDRVIKSRMCDLFQLAPEALVYGQNYAIGELHFTQDRFAWLTNGLLQRRPIPHGYFLAVQGTSRVLAAHGELTLTSTTAAGKDEDQRRRGDTLKGKPVPAFLIREFSSGGMFIYACFHMRPVDGYKQVFRNLMARLPAPNPLPEIQETRALRTKLKIARITNIVLGALFFLLLAKEVIGDSWAIYIGGALSGAVMGYLSNKLTDWLNRYAS